MDTKLNEILLKKNLLKLTDKKNFFKARDYYWDNCIQQYGYSKFPTTRPESPEKLLTDEELAFMEFEMSRGGFKKEVNKTLCQNCGTQYPSDEICGLCSRYYSSEKTSYDDLSRSSISSPYGYNKTYITVFSEDSDKKLKRLSEIQKWVTTDPEEQKLKVDSEKIDSILQSLGMSNDSVRLYAIDLMYNIRKYYTKNVSKLKLNRGSLRLGYIALSVYYAILKVTGTKVNMNLIVSPLGATLADLPEAKRNMDIIFKGF